jgi:ribonuclease HI
MGALLAGLDWVKEHGAIFQLVVNGDSKLTIDFFNRSARPSNTELFLGLKEGQKKLHGMKTAFRHIPRAENQLADWLTRVARTHQISLDLTTICHSYLPS